MSRINEYMIYSIINVYIGRLYLFIVSNFVLGNVATIIGTITIIYI